MNDVNMLINRVRSGDPAAGAIVVSVFGRRLMHYLRTIAPDISDVDREMIAERSIEAAVANITRYEPDQGTFDTWVRGYVRRKLLEHYRTNPAQVATDLLTGDDWPEVVATTADESPNEVVVEVATALRNLTPSDQLIISLRDINGLTYQQIADQLSMSVATCRQRHRRAVANLRNALSSDRS